MTIRRAAPRSADAALASRVFAGALAVVIGAGVVFRVAGAVTTPLWNDEARQAIALSGDIDLAELAAWPLHLRPVLYLLLGKLSLLVHNAEWVLRLTSLVPSIAAVFVTLAVARRLFASRVAVLFCVICTSLSPWLIDFAKEYKPYALEHCVVIVQCALAWQWLERRSAAALHALLVVAAISPLLGFACIFVSPFVVLVVAIDAWRSDRRGVAALALGAGAAAAALFGAQYLVFQRHATRMGFDYWSENFYDTGFSPGRLAGHLLDITGRFAAGALPSDRWSAAVVAANAALFAAGIAVLAVRRRWQLLLVVLGPLALPIVASFAGRWPYGMVRVNLYMIGPVVLAWSAAVDAAVVSPRLGRAGVAVAGLLVALQLPLEPGLVLDKQLPAAHMRPVLPAMDMPALLDALVAAEGGSAGSPACVHVSAEARPVFTYYTRYHAGAAARGGRLRIGRMLSDNTRYTMPEIDSALRGEVQPCWLVRSHRYDEQLAYRRVLRDGGFRVLGEVAAAGLVATRIERVPRPIVAAADGSIALAAEDAVLHGGGLWFHGRARIGDVQGLDPRWASDAIGNWTSVDEAVSWTFEVARPSELEVLVSQAGGPEIAASEYAVVLDDRTLRATVQPTRGWRDFAVTRVGVVKLEPGRHSVWVRVIARRGPYVMNLRGVTLTPRDAHGAGSPGPPGGNATRAGARSAAAATE